MRPVRLPPEVGGRLYLDAMPGRQEPFETARIAIVREQIGHVVCLAGSDEIREASPGYHAALLRGVPWRHVAHPVPDLGVPPDRPAFCALAKQVADLLRAGGAVMIHCRAGIGRSGLLAAGVLMALGQSRAEAARAVRAAGAGPETPAQEEILDWIADAHRRGAEQ